MRKFKKSILMGLLTFVVMTGASQAFAAGDSAGGSDVREIVFNAAVLAYTEDNGFPRASTIIEVLQSNYTSAKYNTAIADYKGGGIKFPNIKTGGKAVVVKLYQHKDCSLPVTKKNHVVKCIQGGYTLNMVE